MHHSIASQTWAQRAQAELGAQHRFKELTEQLIDAKASLKIIKISHKAIEDEKRHSVLCSEVAKELGHSTGFEFFESQPMEFIKPWETKETSFANQLLCEVVLMCCITETINASLLHTLYSSKTTTKDNKALSIIKQILKDEVKHSQMGWAYLAEESQKRDCSFIGKYLDSMLEISVKDELFAPRTSIELQNESQSLNFGVLPVEDRLIQFTSTLKELVLPGFANFNIKTEKAEEWVLLKSTKL